MSLDSEELKNLVGSTIDNIQEGLKNKGYHISGAIEFEVAVVNMAKAEGGIKLYVVKAEGKHTSENVSKIKFKVEKTKTDSDLPILISSG